MSLRLDETLQTATQLYEQGHLEEALALTESALEWHPDHGPFWELRGLIHRARKECHTSLYCLETASVFLPLSPAGRCALADAYSQTGRHELACDLYRSLLVWREVPCKVLLQAAAGLDGLGHPGLALKACREAVRRDPEAAQAYYDMGYYMGRCRYPPAMIESMARKAVALEPDRGQFPVGLASFLWKHDWPEEAHRAIRHLTAEQLDEIPCRCCLERVMAIYEKAGDWEQVRLCHRRLLSTEEQEPDQS